MLFMFLVEPPASAAEPGVEQRVWQVENELLPPVLVKGETPSKSTLSERMQALHVPGVSVAVIHRGKIEWARGFGVTKEAGAAVNSHTLFQAASISKVVATVMVMKLIQAGKIDLGADANRYLKVWKIPSSSYTDERNVSVLDLVTHTSGAAALRRLITGLASGTPNYDEMAPAYAAINRQQLPMLKASLEKLGSIQSIDFIRVGAAAQDVYIVKFEHGDREFSILLEPDGRVHAAQFSP